MVVLGLLLVAAAAVFGTEVVLSNTQTTDGEAFTEVVEGLSAGEFFLIGAGTALALVIGLMLMVSGLGRGRARRAQAKHRARRQRDEIHETESELSSVAEENERLRAELAAERRDRLTMGGAAVPPPMADGDTAYDVSTRDVAGAPNETTGREMRGYDPYPGESIGSGDNRLDQDRTTGEDRSIDLDRNVDETQHTDAGRRR
jgi:hypothetical protein